MVLGSNFRCLLIDLSAMPAFHEHFKRVVYYDCTSFCSDCWCRGPFLSVGGAARAPDRVPTSEVRAVIELALYVLRKFSRPRESAAQSVYLAYSIRSSPPPSPPSPPRATAAPAWPTSPPPPGSPPACSTPTPRARRRSSRWWCNARPASTSPRSPCRSPPRRTPSSSRWCGPRSTRSSTVRALAAAEATEVPADIDAEVAAIVAEHFDAILSCRTLLRLVERCAADWPALAAAFYEDGRQVHLERLARYLDRRRAAGLIAPIGDTAIAARFVLETDRVVREPPLRRPRRRGARRRRGAHRGRRARHPRWSAMSARTMSARPSRGSRAATTALHLATANLWGYHRDEFYYLACGRRLAWGYVDHPPVTPSLYRLADVTVGASKLGLRITPGAAARRDGRARRAPRPRARRLDRAPRSSPRSPPRSPRSCSPPATSSAPSPSRSPSAPPSRSCSCGSSTAATPACGSSSARSPGSGCSTSGRSRSGSPGSRSACSLGNRDVLATPWLAGGHRGRARALGAERLVAGPARLAAARVRGHAARLRPGARWSSSASSCCSAPARSSRCPGVALARRRRRRPPVPVPADRGRRGHRRHARHRRQAVLHGRGAPGAARGRRGRASTAPASWVLPGGARRRSVVLLAPLAMPVTPRSTARHAARGQPRARRDGRLGGARGAGARAPRRASRTPGS